MKSLENNWKFEIKTIKQYDKKGGQFEREFVLLDEVYKLNEYHKKYIKKAVLEFEKVLQINYDITNDTIFIELLKDYKEIFGGLKE